MPPTEVVIVSGARTPMAEWIGGKRGDGRPGGALASVSAIELGAVAVRGALARAGLPPGRIDHVVITGDISNLALEAEFDRARSVFARLGMAPEQISIIPGNHDVYTRGAERSRRFAQFFAPHISSDLPLNDSANHPSGPFPFVRLRDEVAIIGLSSAVARLPILAHGHLGQRQLSALATALAHPELARRTPVV